MTIDDLGLATLLAQVHIFAPKMHTLAHIITVVYNTAAQEWANCGSVSLEATNSHILWDLTLLTRTHKIYCSSQRIAGANNNMANAASRLTHLTYNMFLHLFTLTLPQIKP